MKLLGLPGHQDNSICYYIGILFLFSIFICSPHLLFGQELSAISGIIKNEQGTPLENVNIHIAEMHLGTKTAASGNYQLKEIPAGKHTLIISSVGYEKIRKNITLTPGQTQTFNFTLKEASYQLGKMVIRGKSTLEKINEQAYNVDAVSTKKFYNSAVDLTGILDRLSSIRVMREGGLGSDYTFSLNGFTGNQVKFFIDGMPVQSYDNSFNLANIPLNAIKRLEVYNGVVPIELGGDALGGAVNIITNKNANFFGASYTLGSFNTHRASVDAAYTNDKTGFTIRGNMGFNYSDNNYDVKVDVEQDALGNNSVTQTVPRFHNQYKSGRIHVETGFVNRSFADHLLLGITATGSNSQVQNGSTMNSVYGGITQNNRALKVDLKYRKRDLFTKNLNLNFSAAYQYNQVRNVDTLQGITFNWAGEKFITPGDQTGELGGLPFDQFQYNNGLNTQLNIGYKITPKQSLALNHSFSHLYRHANDQRDPNKITNQYPKSLDKNILGLSYKYDFNKKWTTTLFGKSYFLHAQTSKKYDVDDASRAAFETNKSYFGYGVATSYFLLPNLQLKTSYEHTYRLPTPTEIFGNGLFVEPNPELKPENSDNINFGANYQLSVGYNSHFDLGGSFIYRNSEDLIFQVVTISSPSTSYENLAKVRTIGVEGNINYDYKNRFQIGVNVTYQNITDQADFVYNDYSGYQKNFNKGERLPNRPYLFGNANASYSFNHVIFNQSKLSIKYYLHYVQEFYLSWANLGNKDGKNIIPQQISHNLGFTYSLENGKYNLSFEVRNLTDELLYDKFYLQKPGRAFFLKLRYTL
ncbi:MAG TPA: TonB-dependent receptor [Chitinophagaceae bacterium]|nr:TonB-dependent receptor [Chitinophagaceae bacterium]